MTITLNEKTRWIIDAAQPFRGNVVSVLTDNGTVAYTNGLTLEQYQAERGGSLRCISDAELDQLIETYVASLITPWAPITREQWDYALNVLPPSRWGEVNGIEMFHICERVTHDLVGWYATDNQGHYLTCNSRAGADRAQLAAEAKATIEKGGPNAIA